MQASTKQRGQGRYSVYFNGEDIGMVYKTRVFGKTEMWRSSLTGRRNYDTKKLAVDSTVETVKGA